VDAQRIEFSELIRWLHDEVTRRGWSHSVVVYDELASCRDDRVRLPVFVDTPDLEEKITKLQELEDAWNNSEPWRYPRLTIIPAKQGGIVSHATED